MEDIHSCALGCSCCCGLFGEQSLCKTVREYLAHYHGERNHQGLGNAIIEPGEEVGRVIGKIKGQPRVGGLLKYYYRDAA